MGDRQDHSRVVNRTVSIRDLDPYSSYIIRVSATNNEGLESEPRTVAVTTMELGLRLIGLIQLAVKCYIYLSVSHTYCLLYCSSLRQPNIFREHEQLMR